MIRSLASAVALAFLLAACGRGPDDGDPRPGAEESGHAHAGGGHDEAGHEGESPGHDDAGHAHAEGGEGQAHADGTTIAADIAEASGIRVAPAAAGTIADEHEVQGLLTPVEGRLAQVAARYPGPIRSLAVNVGDRVRAGQVLATVESNLSLSSYSVTSPISGVVLARALVARPAILIVHEALASFGAVERAATTARLVDACAGRTLVMVVRDPAALDLFDTRILCEGPAVLSVESASGSVAAVAGVAG